MLINGNESGRSRGVFYCEEFGIALPKTKLEIR